MKPLQLTLKKQWMDERSEWRELASLYIEYRHILITHNHDWDMLAEYFTHI